MTTKSQNKKILLYLDDFISYKELTNEELGELFRGVLDYYTTKQYKIDNRLIQFMFDRIKNNLDVLEKKYNEVAEKRRIIGSIGGKKRVANAKISNQLLENPTNCLKFQPNSSNNININNNINNNIQEKEIYKEKEVLLLGEQKEETESCKKYMGYTDNELCEKTLYNWNEWIAKDNGFPKISGVNKTRLSKLKARMKQAGGYREFWEKLDSAIKDSRFLRFGNETWTCNFDFVLQESSYTKILEHQYK